MNPSNRQCEAARSAGFDYIWVIILEDGTQLVQFDESGEECMAPKHLLVQKDADDFYKHSALFSGVAAAGLVPVWPTCSPVWVDLSAEEDLVLFRRVYNRMGKIVQMVYAIGKRRDGIESVLYVCPVVGEEGLLPTLIEFSSDPEYTVSYERGFQVAEGV